MKLYQTSSSHLFMYLGIHEATSRYKTGAHDSQQDFSEKVLLRLHNLQSFRGEMIPLG